MSFLGKDIDRLVMSLWAIAEAEDPEAQLAIASLARNLAARGLSADAIEERLSHLACRFIDQAPAPSLSERFREPGFPEWVEILCTAFTGRRHDPTRGATRAHRHDEEPAWAKDLCASALVGPWLFYCE